jgi:DNA-binding transcriptional MerR regulator
MAYNVKQLADLAGVSVRTLHYYDQKGLLRAQRQPNGYRSYGERELLRLQQILFFRELDFSLEEVKKIVDSPDFNVLAALEGHRRTLKLEVKRLRRLIATTDNTIRKLKGEIMMSDDEYFAGFSQARQNQYEQEIRERYGPALLEESKRRTRDWRKEDYRQRHRESMQIFTAIQNSMHEGAGSPAVQAQIAKLKDWLNLFYTCNEDTLLGLGHMYNEHPDFVKMFKTRFSESLPGFLLKAIEIYCAEKTQKS